METQKKGSIKPGGQEEKQRRIQEEIKNGVSNTANKLIKAVRVRDEEK